MKDDERQFLAALSVNRPRQIADGVFATDVATKIGMNEKRALYLLGKWTDKGWWEYGVSLRSGWFTAAGLAAISELFPSC